MTPYNQISNIYSADNSVTITQVNGSPISQGNVTLNPVAINVTANIAAIRQALSGSQYINYNNTTGVITLVYPNPFKEDSDSTDGWDYEPADFVKVEDVDQSIAGVKTFSDTLQLTQSGVLKFDSDWKVQLSGTSLRFVPGGLNGSVTFDNYGSITATGDISGLSDRNLKENIVPIENALDKVKQISGYTFNFKGDTTKKTGVIAQEIQAVMPEAVGEQDDNLTVAHGNLVGLLFSAINELQDEIAELKKRLDEE
jgi:hypothetical protein